jgi:hypothetical protein
MAALARSALGDIPREAVGAAVATEPVKAMTAEVAATIAAMAAPSRREMRGTTIVNVLES